MTALCHPEVSLVEVRRRARRPPPRAGRAADAAGEGRPGRFHAPAV